MDVALIILCCDQGRSLGATLASAHAQSLPFREVVVVDCGSSDPFTLKALSQLSGVRAGSDNLALACNEAIRASSAASILVVEADDVLEPTCCEALSKVSADVVASPRLVVGRSSPITPGAFDPVSALSDGFFPSCSMFRRSLWEMTGGLDEGLGASCWEDLWLRAMGLGLRGELVPEPLIRRGPQPTLTSRDFEALVRKHERLLTPLTEELLARRVEARDREEARAARLASRRADVEREIADLNLRCDEVGHEILAMGHAPLDWGELRRLEPFSPLWGIDRGQPIDRVYIEEFLQRHSADIRGVVLEVKDTHYTERFGRNVVRADALDIDSTNTRAQLHVDLTDAWAIPDNTYDCIIVTQTLHIIYDFRAALFHLRRTLKPGGVLLCTLPALSRTNPEGAGLSGGDAWRFTEHSTRRTFAELFPPDACEVEVRGNVLAATAFLQGLGAHELSPAELSHVDPWNPLLFGVRAVKPAGKVHRDKERVGLILAYHRVADLPGAAAKLCVPPPLFRAHMELLRRRFCPVSLDDLLNGAIPDKAVAVTFDDGYLDALTEAAPVLADLGIPATFFVTTERLHEERETWHDRIDGLLESGASLPSTLRIGDLELMTGTSAERASASVRLQHLYRKKGLRERTELLEQLREWSGTSNAARPSHRLMRDAELMELCSNPKFSIGAHSIHHLSLAHQPEETVLREVSESRTTLAKLFGRAPRVFAYPYGEYETATTETVRRAGFDAAVTVHPGVVRPGMGRMTLPRLEIGRLEPETFGKLLDETFEGGR